MFDGIGHTKDEEQGKRRAASAGLTSLILASVVGFWVGVGLFTVIPDLVPDEDPPIVFTVLPEEEELVAKADLPPAPPVHRVAKGGGTAEAKPVDTFDPDVRPLDEPEKKIADQNSFGKGPQKQPGMGHCEGTDCIVSDNVGDPKGMGKGPRRVHHSEVDRKKKVNPQYPRAAQALGLGSVSCRVLVTIDSRGAPTNVVVEDCPLVFHPESKDAMLRSRWYPPTVEGERLNSAEFLVVINFDLR
mgnify:CR=1 FL=1